MASNRLTPRHTDAEGKKGGFNVAQGLARDKTGSVNEVGQKEKVN